MATLNSAGVSISLINESFYADGATGEGVLLLTASRSNKLNPSGSLAIGTIPDAKGQILSLSSRSNLLDFYGHPTFRNVNGTPIHGDETNEYGLHAAYQALAVTNNVSVLNADIDLAQLEGSKEAPTQPVFAGTHWLDLSKLAMGLFSWDETESKWVKQEVSILNDEPATGNVQPVANGIANPKDTFGVNGEYAVVTSISPMIVYQKVGGTWVMLGAEVHPADFQFAPHTRIPSTRADGSALVQGDLFIKTTTPNNGFYSDMSVYDADLSRFISKECPVFTLNNAATDYFSGKGELVEGVIYSQIDHEGKLNPFYNVSSVTPKSSDGVAVFTYKRYNGNAFVEATSTIDVPEIDLATYPALSVVINGVTVVFDASVSRNGTTVKVDDIVNFLQTVPELLDMGIRTELVNETRIKLINTKGYDITVKNVGEVNTDWTPNTMSDVAAVLGFKYSVSNGQQIFRQSNWEVLDYIPSFDVPTRDPDAGTLWYSTDLRMEFLQSYFDVATNQMKWKAYAWSEDDGSSGLSQRCFVRSSQPTNAINGDIWVDSTDIENYPVIKIKRNNTWTTLDNTDQTTTDGVLFSNYAYKAPFDESGNPRELTAVNEYAPDPELYPEGIIMFNMDYSGYNVKEYRGDGEWITVSGLKADGSPYMGRKAQRAIVVKSLKEAIINSVDARARNYHFYLMACPGYPELLPELNALNIQRKNTGFVIGSTPMRLKAVANEVRNWAQNTKGSLVDGEDGLVSYDDGSAIWAFAGIQTDSQGNQIVAPSDVLALDTILRNDQQSYQWFAPAGDTRGIVKNTTAIGHVEGTEFVKARFDDGLVDTLYLNNINPIIQYAGQPIKVWGQKTLTTTASAMDRINVSRLMAYIRYNLERIVQPFIFEPNDSQTRNAVKSIVEGFLSDIVDKRGLSDFVVQCDTSINTNARIDRNELWINLAVVPTKSVEFIFIPIRLKNTGAI